MIPVYEIILLLDSAKIDDTLELSLSVISADLVLYEYNKQIFGINIAHNV